MEYHTIGKGGGLGITETYIIWQERNETVVTGYNSQITADLYLTGINMWDRMYDHLFATTHKQIPQEARIDDRECIGNFSDGNISSAGSRCDATPQKNSFDEDVRANSTVLGNFQQHRENNHEKVINELISAFSSASPNHNDKIDVISESLQRQILVKNSFDKQYHWCLQKRSQRLKRRGKMQSKHHNQKSKKYSFKVAEREGIIESLGLALSRHAKELKKILGWC